MRRKVKKRFLLMCVLEIIFCLTINVYAENSFGDLEKAPDGYSIEKEGERYSLSVEKASVISIIETLFAKSEKEYSLLTKANPQVESLSYKNKSFEDLLTLILEQANLTYSINKNIFYIYETTRNEIIKKYMEDSSHVIKLKYIKSNELVKSLPPYLKKDLESNDGTLPAGEYEGRMLSSSGSYLNAIEIQSPDYLIHADQITNPEQQKKREEKGLSNGPFTQPYSKGCQIMHLDDFNETIGILHSVGFESNGSDIVKVKIKAAENE